MRLLKSVEELLYELVTWILFYPLTLWRSIVHPISMMSYAESELGDSPEDQYADALSPPIYLLITLFLAHLIELGFAADTKVVLPALLADDRNLLLFRAVAFSVFPLLFAIHGVRMRKARLTRQTLRPAFYSQCYTAAPFVLAVDLSFIIGQHGSSVPVLVGTAIFVVGLVWYVAVQTAWFRSRSGMPAWRAALLVLATTILAALVVFAVAAVTVLVTRP